MSTPHPSPRPARATMSIGQVIDVLKSDFPDVSVSKIRFLESEGLIEPERTASGYRKFAPGDVDRLRTILKLQRDSYMPLKVIREHLAAMDASAESVPPDAPRMTAVPPLPDEQRPQPMTPVPSPPAGSSAPVEDLGEPLSKVHLTESDLADESGLEIGQVRSLRDYGVICEHSQNGATFFDGDDLAVAKLARDFLKLGLDARHLKTLRRFAEQEAALFEQLVMPGLRNKKPETRKQAAETVRELTSLSRKLRFTYLRGALRDVVTGDF